MKAHPTALRNPDLLLMTSSDKTLDILIDLFEEKEDYHLKAIAGFKVKEM